MFFIPNCQVIKISLKPDMLFLEIPIRIELVFWDFKYFNNPFQLLLHSLTQTKREYQPVHYSNHIA